jgi:hypothetical protein
MPSEMNKISLVSRIGMGSGAFYRYLKILTAGFISRMLLRETELASSAIAKYREGRLREAPLTSMLEAPSLTRIFIATGCPYWKTSKVVRPPLVTSTDHAVLHKCLYRLLDASMPAIESQIIPTLIGGVARHGLWPRFVAEEAGAYALAAGLLQYSANATSRMMYRAAAENLTAATTADVLVTLNNWIKPKTQWDELPEETCVARALFGDAWVMMFEMTAPDGASIGDAVYRDRPPFLPGRCPALDGPTAHSLSLPTLGLEP